MPAFYPLIDERIENKHSKVCLTYSTLFAPTYLALQYELAKLWTATPLEEVAEMN